MKNRLYDNYTMFCLKKSERMQTSITPLSTDDEIRTYMFGEHNQNAKQEIHKAIPYHISDPKISRAISPSFLETLKQKGIHLPSQLEEYIIFHVGLPVDTMSKQELVKYTSNETKNPRLRQPAA